MVSKPTPAGSYRELTLLQWGVTGVHIGTGWQRELTLQWGHNGSQHTHSEGVEVL